LWAITSSDSVIAFHSQINRYSESLATNVLQHELQSQSAWGGAIDSRVRKSLAECYDGLTSGLTCDWSPSQRNSGIWQQTHRFCASQQPLQFASKPYTIWRARVETLPSRSSVSFESASNAFFNSEWLLSVDF
jgi:hypothetical protein